jgi:uncharacterized membrane protein YdjX (TVP38/TMEM64 family)
VLRYLPITILLVLGVVLFDVLWHLLWLWLGV